MLLCLRCGYQDVKKPAHECPWCGSLAFTTVQTTRGAVGAATLASAALTPAIRTPGRLETRLQRQSQGVAWGRR